MATFKERIKEKRTEEKWDTSEAAEKIGISKKLYEDYEYGMVSATYVEKLGVFVGMGLDRDSAIELANEIQSSNLGDAIWDLIDTETPSPYVYVEDGIIYFDYRNDSGSTYDIAINRIDNSEMVMRWIEQLSSKTWITKYHLRQFVQVCSEHLGTSLHPIG